MNEVHNFQYNEFIRLYKIDEEQFLDDIVYGDGYIVERKIATPNFINPMRAGILEALKLRGLKVESKFLVSIQLGMDIKFYYEGYHNTLTYKDYFN